MGVEMQDRQRPAPLVGWMIGKVIEWSPPRVTALVGLFLAEVDAMGGAGWDWCSLMERQRRFAPGTSGKGGQAAVHEPDGGAQR